MKIVCDSCGAKYSIADEKVAGKIFKIRCKKCSSVLEVRGDLTGAHPSEGAGGSADRGGEAAWYIVVDGEQKGPLAPIELSQLFAKGSVGLDSYVWKEGFDDWKVAGDVSELAQIFGKSAAQANAPAATDDTSAFTTGRDLFGDGGREPTTEVEPSGLFGSFDERPTPTEGGEAPMAAAPADAGQGSGVLGQGAGAMGAGAAPQRMTGQRNENSVLFSLSNLQQLASRSGGSGAAAPSASEPAPVAQPSPQASGEGSGLIDIRALAKSTTPGTKAAPSQAVDDLLAIGTGTGGAALGGPLLGPAPMESSDGNRWLWIGGAALLGVAIIAVSVVAGMALGGPDDDSLEITAAAETPTAKGGTAPGEVTAAAQAPADPSPDPVAEQPLQEAATIDDPVAPPPDTGSELAAAAPEPAARKRTTSTESRRRRTASASDAPAPAPAPKRRGGDNLDALMDEVVGGSSSPQPKQARRTTSSSDSGLPDSPSRNDVKTALQGVSGGVKSCRKDSGGTATVNVTFSGKTGRATNAKITSGPFKGTPVGSCIESAVKRARVPRFKQSAFKVTFPYRL